MFDVVVDTTGSELTAYRRLVAARGRMVTITPDPRHLVRSAGAIAASTVFADRRVRIFFGAPRRQLFADLAAYVENGDIRPVIDTVHPLTDVAVAHRALEARGSRGKGCPNEHGLDVVGGVGDQTALRHGEHLRDVVSGGGAQTLLDQGRGVFDRRDLPIADRELGCSGDQFGGLGEGQRSRSGEFIDPSGVSVGLGQHRSRHVGHVLDIDERLGDGTGREGHLSGGQCGLEALLVKSWSKLAALSTVQSSAEARTASSAERMSAPNSESSQVWAPCPESSTGRRTP